MLKAGQSILSSILERRPLTSGLYTPISHHDLFISFTFAISVTFIITSWKHQDKSETCLNLG